MLKPDPFDDPVAPVPEAVHAKVVPPTALESEMEVEVDEQIVVAPVVVTFGTGFTRTLMEKLFPGQLFAVG